MRSSGRADGRELRRRDSADDARSVVGRQSTDPRADLCSLRPVRRARRNLDGSVPCVRRDGRVGRAPGGARERPRPACATALVFASASPRQPPRRSPSKSVSPSREQTRRARRAVAPDLGRPRRPRGCVACRARRGRRRDRRDARARRRQRRGRAHRRAARRGRAGARRGRSPVRAGLAWVCVVIAPPHGSRRSRSRSSTCSCCRLAPPWASTRSGPWCTTTHTRCSNLLSSESQEPKHT